MGSKDLEGSRGRLVIVALAMAATFGSMGCVSSGSYKDQSQISEGKVLSGGQELSSCETYESITAIGVELGPEVYLQSQLADIEFLTSDNIEKILDRRIEKLKLISTRLFKYGYFDQLSSKTFYAINLETQKPESIPLSDILDKSFLSRGEIAMNEHNLFTIAINLESHLIAATKVLLAALLVSDPNNLEIRCATNYIDVTPITVMTLSTPWECNINEESLVAAMILGEWDCVDSLLTPGSNLNMNKILSENYRHTPFTSMMCDYSNINVPENKLDDLVKISLEIGADPTVAGTEIEGSSILKEELQRIPLLCRLDNSNVAKQIIIRGSLENQVDETNENSVNTVKRLANELGKPELVSFLEFDPDSCSVKGKALFGRTFLAEAAENRHVERVSEVLEYYGADPNYTEENCMPSALEVLGMIDPYWLATDEYIDRSLKVLELLVDYGVDFESTNIFGNNVVVGIADQIGEQESSILSFFERMRRDENDAAGLEIIKSQRKYIRALLGAIEEYN